MTTETHTMAGLQASASAARLGSETHACAGWTSGSIAKPSTFMVVNRKNCPTRPLSERSP